MSQTSYPTVMAGPYAGLLAEEHPSIVTSKVNSEASAAIATGVFVKRDTTNIDADAVKNMAAAGDMPWGITIFKPGVERFNKGLGAGPLLFAPKERIDICEKGRVWVRTETDIAVSLAATAIFLRVIANGANTTLGAITKTSDTTNTRAFVTGIRVIYGCSAAGVALIEFDSLMCGTVAS
jgi:hypothetical protein